MTPKIVAKAMDALRRDRDLPVAELARKIQRNLLAFATARISLRACDALGPRARCFGGAPHVDNRGAIRIGADFALACTYGTVQLASGASGLVEMGDGVTINYGTAISARSRVRLGDNVMVGPYCVIADSDIPLPLEATGDAVRPIDIGPGVWLGGRVVVLPGARIGENAVIAAGSVVSGEIPPNSVASGNPARVLRVTATAAPESQVRGLGGKPDGAPRPVVASDQESRRVALR